MRMNQPLWLRIAVLLLLSIVCSAQSADAPVPTVTKDMVPPRAIESPEPPYTEKARRDGVAGVVVVRVVIGVDGNPKDVQVIRHLEDSLDESAAETIKKWRFTPAEKDGHPVAVRVNIEVVFHLGVKPQDR